MIDDLKPYPAMKDSGIPWLGKVPEHWGLRRMKTLLHERIEKGFPNEPLLAATQNKGVVRKEWYENRTVEAQKDLHLLKLVYKGDFVISLRSFQGGIEYARDRGIISPAYTVLYPLDPTIHGYLAWLFKSKPFIENLTIHVTGIRQGQNIDYDRLSRSSLPLPQPEERDAIIRFLDYIDRLVQRYIHAKQKLIKLLEEQKQAIIHRTVIYGLDPNIRLKPSGVEWLGDVPEHWQNTRLKFVTRIQTGITLGKVYSTDKLMDRPYLRVANVQDGYLDLRDIATIHVPISEAKACELQPGDVLMTEGGDIDKLGRGCVWHGEISSCLHQNHIFAVRPNSNMLLPDYLAFLMTSNYGRIYFILTAKQTTNLASTNSTTLKAFPLFLPDIEEQRMLLEYISRKSSSLDAAISSVRRDIDLIHEYRTRLISDVVTGKLDVRGIKLPATDDADTLVEWNSLQDAEANIEDQEMQEEVLSEGD